MNISRAGKPCKPQIAEQDANVNLSFLHRLQVISVPLLTSDIVVAGKPSKPRIAEWNANVFFTLILSCLSRCAHQWPHWRKKKKLKNTAWVDSNPRPLDYDATALPTELLCFSTSQEVKTYLYKVFASLRNSKMFYKYSFGVKSRQAKQTVDCLARCQWLSQEQASQANRRLPSKMPMWIFLFYIVYKSFQSLCSPVTSL